MCSGFKPKARFYWLLGLKNRHFYAVPGTAGKSSSADKPRGSAEALENSRIILGTVSGIKFQKADPSTGAFEGDGIQFVEGINNSNPSQNQMYSWSRPNFSAARSSSIYGNSSTVHPDSLRFLALIRSY